MSRSVAAIVHAWHRRQYADRDEATILDGAKIGQHVIIGANSLVPQRQRNTDRSLVFGSPAKVIRA